MSLSVSSCSVEAITARVAPLREKLASHPLYSRIATPEHLRFFMESHVFAVWDFMSLLKALQSRLTCTTAPWIPTQWPNSRRFINEIVLGEESDLYSGRAISHFELYLEAMDEFGADTQVIRKLITRLSTDSREIQNISMKEVMGTIEAPEAARLFVESTFDNIGSSRICAMAAAFTFGREDVIPDIFQNLVRDLHREESSAGAASLAKYIWYLERHIEVDGDDHGPLSLRMVADLCGDEEELWEEAAQAAEQALAARLRLWDGILSQISNLKTKAAHYS